ncbi:class I SAM-dependent methyltransferase [Candidatus Hakubella thermalkaliphila]|nr:methyltransferase domain-containing protein [Candidatus Hakubella thermalkaliphila]
MKKYAVGNTVLDIGCGKGWYSIFLKDEGFDVYAIDIEKQFEDDRIIM